MSISRQQRERIAEHGPYTLRSSGILMDRNGVAMARLYDKASGEECAWDRAVVAALNKIAGGEAA